MIRPGRPLDALQQWRPAASSSQAAMPGDGAPRKTARSGPRSKTSPYIGVSQVRSSGAAAAVAVVDLSLSCLCCTSGPAPAAAGCLADRRLPWPIHPQYKRTGRWEAHVWQPNAGPSGKGRQLHLGSFLTPYQAARCAGQAALRAEPLHASHAAHRAAARPCTASARARCPRRRAGRTTAPRFLCAGPTPSSTFPWPSTGTTR